MDHNKHIPFFQQYAIDKIMSEYTKYDVLNFIDVGCFNGGWLNIFRQLANGKKMFTIAIDPIRQSLKNNPELEEDPPLDLYDVFLEVAISKTNGEQNFYRYSSEQNGSLLISNPQGITFDKNDKSKFWINNKMLGIESIDDITKIKSIKKVKCLTLESIYNEFLLGKKIHFLKIDTQGTDIDSFLSLGEENILRNCLFVQLECTMSRNNSAKMYIGGSNFYEDEKIMSDLGYAILNVRGYGHQTSEADVLFYNRGRIDK